MPNYNPKTTHGLSKTATYRVWADMKTRCYNPNRHQFKYYGERGITVCERWLNCFENFLLDMGEKPEGLTIDRIDNNGDYSPDNCRWVSQKAQCNNRRTNKTITFQNETLTYAQWSVRLGAWKGLVGERIKAGWSEVLAITTPPES